MKLKLVDAEVDATRALREEEHRIHHKTRFPDLVREMVAADLKKTAAENGLNTGTS